MAGTTRSRLAHFAAAWLIAGTLGGCSESARQGSHGHSGTHTESHAADPTSDVALGGGGAAGVSSVPDFALTDQHGARFAREQLDGSFWVADFIFTRCTNMCPRLTARMAELQAELAKAPHGRDVRLVSFSIDPEYDRPEVLAAYAARHGADPARWTFATGGREEIWRLSTAGFKLAVGEPPAESDQPLFHTDKFVLVDGRGQIRGYYPAMDSGEGLASLLHDLHALREKS